MDASSCPTPSNPCTEDAGPASPCFLVTAVPDSDGSDDGMGTFAEDVDGSMVRAAEGGSCDGISGLITGVEGDAGAWRSVMTSLSSGEVWPFP